MFKDFVAFIRQAAFVFMCASVLSQSSLAHSAGDTLTRAFLEVALGVEEVHSVQNITPGYIRKWRDEIRLRVSFYDFSERPSVELAVNEATSRFVDIVQSIGHPLNVEDRENANFFIYVYETDAQFLQMRDEFAHAFGDMESVSLICLMNTAWEQGFVSKGKGCMAAFLTVEDGEAIGEIQMAIVLVPTYSNHRIFFSCFAEETAQALGLPNDLDYGQNDVDTIFDDSNWREDLSPVDIKFLYSPVIQPGMTKDSVLELIRKTHLGNNAVHIKYHGVFYQMSIYSLK